MLEAVAERHMISVKMLTYLYEGNFSSSEIWSLLEDYFLGVIPEKVKQDCRSEKPDIVFDWYYGMRFFIEAEEDSAVK